MALREIPTTFSILFTSYGELARHRPVEILFFLKQLLIVILVALFHFPKFQLGTKMGSRDIGKMVTEKLWSG